MFFEYTLFWEKKNDLQQLPKYETFYDLFFNFWIWYIVEILPNKILKKRITVPCLNRPTYFSPSLCWNSPWPCGTPCFQSPTNVSPFDHLNSSREYHIQNWYLAFKICSSPYNIFFCQWQRSKMLTKQIESWVGEVNQTLSRAFNNLLRWQDEVQKMPTFVHMSTLRWVDGQNSQKMST